jgi:long-chain acyl-CoA synthetase
MDKPWLKHYQKNVAHEINPDQYDSLRDMLDISCEKYSKQVFMKCIDVDMTFGEFRKEADCMAEFMQKEWDIKKGDRIAIMLPNLHDFPVVFYAAQKIGAVCVATNPLYTPREMAHQFKDAGAKAIVIFEHFAFNLEKIIDKTDIKNVVTVGIGDRLPLWKKTLVNVIIKATKANPPHGLKVTKMQKALKKFDGSGVVKCNISNEETAILQYTGGTTGVSKGAMLTHRNVIANVLQNLEWIGGNLGTEPQTILGALPLYHIYALTVNFLTLAASGHRVVLLPRPIPIKKTIGALKKYKIHMFTGVNTIFNELVNHKDFGSINFDSLICVLAGGMALQDTVADKWEKASGVPAIEGYGLTEASPCTHCNPLDLNTYRRNTIGIPMPSTLSKIVDDEGNEVETGQPGELLIKGPQVMKGYWQRQDETDKCLKDGWLYTGDVATVNEDGFFAIVDRKKDMILVSGFNVFPNEIEGVIAAHPKVLEVAVIGVPDQKSGERVKAFIVCNDKSLNETEIKSYCKENLAGYKCPKAIEFREDLPKAITGKILRRELRTDNITQSN